MVITLWHRLRCSARQHRYCGACRAWECSAATEHPAGFAIPQVTALLTFEGTVYEGAEVRVLLNPSQGVVQQLDGAPTEGQGRVSFGDTILVDWNLSRVGVPVPCDGFHFAQQPWDFCPLVIDAWKNLIVAKAQQETESEDVDVPVLPSNGVLPPEELELASVSQEISHGG